MQYEVILLSEEIFIKNSKIMNEKIIDLGLLEHINKKVDDILAYLRNEQKKQPVSDWLDAQEVMQMLHVSSRTLSTYKKNNLLIYSHISKKKVMFSRESVLKMLDANSSKNKFQVV